MAAPRRAAGRSAAECQAAAVIVSPGARVDSGREVKLTDAGGAGCEACWELTHPALAPIGGCFEAGTTVDVALPANGGYVARLRLRDVATQAVAGGGPRLRGFVAGPPEKCAARLRARSDLATNYREAIEREGRRAFGVEGNGSAVQRSEVYIDLEASPLCYGVVGTSREAVLGTASGARGFWGVDFGRQEFGHGDRILLDFVLSRHRADVRHIAEFGTGGGVTSFYLGVAAALRGGTLDTFDVVDARAPDVLKVWLPSMRFHKADLAGAVANDAVDAAIRAASVVLVDHVDRLEFCRDVVAPRLQRRGLLLEHDFTPHAGPGPHHPHSEAAALSHRGSRLLQGLRGDGPARRWRCSRDRRTSTTSSPRARGPLYSVLCILEPPPHPVGDALR